MALTKPSSQNLVEIIFKGALLKSSACGCVSSSLAELRGQLDSVVLAGAIGMQPHYAWDKNRYPGHKKTNIMKTL